MSLILSFSCLTPLVVFLSACFAGVGSSHSSQWDFWGSTLVTSSYVRLTPDERSKQGSIWNTVVRLETWLDYSLLSQLLFVKFSRQTAHTSWVSLSVGGRFYHFGWTFFFLLRETRLMIWPMFSCNGIVELLDNVLNFINIRKKKKVVGKKDSTKNKVINIFFKQSPLQWKENFFPVSGLQPCHLKDWEMHVQFKIHGSGKKNLHGDGIALWYTKDRLHPGINGVTSKLLLNVEETTTRLDPTLCHLWYFTSV